MAEHWNGGNGGKGSKPRPYSVSQEEFDDRWDLIFGKKDKDKTKNILNTSNNQTHTTVIDTNTDTQEK